MRIHRSILLGIGLAVSVSAMPADNAAAKPTFKTKVVYYTVKANNALQIEREILRRGPHAGGGKAYGTLESSLTVKGLPIQTKKRCVVKDFRIHANFKMTLPKLSSRSQLSPALNRKWASFARFVRKHEERHRAIWLSCWTQAEKQIKALQLKSCNSFNRRSQAIWNKIARSCDRRHAAFDKSEQQRLGKHPLIRSVAVAQSKATTKRRQALRRTAKQSNKRRQVLR